MPKNDKNVGEDGLPADTSPANFGQGDFDANKALREQNVEAAKASEENLTFENADSDEKTTAKVTKGLPINPSSTYPGRDMELAENDMALPTEIDLAKRASFAGTQIPARVHAAGLANLDFNEDAPEEVAGEKSETDEDNA